MKRVIYHSLICLFAIILLGSCDTEIARDKMHALPAFDQKYYQTALKALNEELDGNPENADVYYKKALVLEKLNNRENAILNLRKAVKIDSSNAVYYKKLAELFMQEEQYKRAYTNAKKAEEFGDRSGELYGLLSEVYLDQDRFEQALQYIDKAIEALPGNSNFVFRKGKIYLASGDTAQAKLFILKSLEDVTPSAGRFEAVSDIYYADRDFDAALAYLDSSLAYAKDDRRLVLKKADIFLAAKKPDRAKEVLKSLYLTDTTDAGVATQLAQLYYGRYVYDSALYFVDKAIVNNPKKKEAYLLKGNIFDKKRLYYTAKDQFQNALLIDTGYVDAKTALQDVEKKLAWLQYKKQQEEKAAALPKINTVEPNNISNQVN